MKKNTVLLTLTLVCLATANSVAQVRSSIRRTVPKPEKIGILISKGDSTVSPGSSSVLFARLVDDHGQVMSGSVEWWLDPASDPYIEIGPGADVGTVTVRGRPNPAERPEIKQVQVFASSGNLSSSIVIPYKSKKPLATIKWDQEQPRVEVGKVTSLTATVLDENGGPWPGRGLSAKIDDPETAKWIKIGSPVYDDGKVTFTLEGIFAESSVFRDTALLTIQEDKKTVAQVPLHISLPKMALAIVNPDGTPLPEDRTLYGSGNAYVMKAQGFPPEASKLLKWDVPLEDKDKEYVMYRADGDRLFLTGLTANGKGPKTIPVRYQIGNVFSPTVTLFWNQAPLKADYSVLPDNVARDVFGKTVADDYYCVGVTVSNTSNRDYQVTSIVFVGPDPAHPNKTVRTLAAPYGIVNASQAKRKAWNPRTLAITAATAMGTVLTGFTPFFFNLAHQNQFSKFINLFAIPGKDAVSSVFPDSTKLESASLDAYGYRGDRFITNTPTPASVMFIPKKFADLSSAERSDPAKVKARLGDIEIQGFPMERSSSGPIVLSSSNGKPI